MGRISKRSVELYEALCELGYPAVFCRTIAENLNTEYAAGRMFGYLSHYRKPPMEEIADEMMGILEDRKRFAEKKMTQWANAKWNEYLWNREKVDSDQSVFG